MYLGSLPLRMQTVNRWVVCIVLERKLVMVEAHCTGYLTHTLTCSNAHQAGG